MWRVKPLPLARPLSRRCLYTDITVLGQHYPRDATTNVTTSVLKKVGRKLHLQPAHPLGILRTLIESHWPTWTHLSSNSPVVTPARNFDDLSFPANHPGRARSDSYYLNRKYMLRTHTSAHEVETFAQWHAEMIGEFERCGAGSDGETWDEQRILVPSAY